MAHYPHEKLMRIRREHSNSSGMGEMKRHSENEKEIDFAANMILPGQSTQSMSISLFLFCGICYEWLKMSQSFIPDWVNIVGCMMIILHCCSSFRFISTSDIQIMWLILFRCAKSSNKPDKLKTILSTVYTYTFNWKLICRDSFWASFVQTPILIESKQRRA